MSKIQLRAESFEDMINRRGHPVLWQEAMKCTCWFDDSGQPDYDCEYCDAGYIYKPPIFSRHVVVLALVWQRDFKPVGEHRLGDAVATIPYNKRYNDKNSNLIQTEFNELYNIGEWDLVILQDSTFRSHEVLIKDKPVYKRKANTLRNEHGVKILSIISTRKSDGVIYYKEGVDFLLEGNEIKWVEGGKAPYNTEKYSVTYFHNPVYVVHTSLPQSRDYDNQHLPKKVVLRYRDVM